MGGAVVTGAFAMAAIGAFYLLARRQVEYGRLFLRVGVSSRRSRRSCSCAHRATGTASWSTRYQPATLAAMEGLFQRRQGAGIVLIGQPDTDANGSTTRSTCRTCSAF